MKKLLLMILLANVGCSPLYNLTNSALRDEKGWNLSGYVAKDNKQRLKFGNISSELLYSNAQHNKTDKIEIEESLKNEGFIIGIFFEKSF